ncbi:hypothetical protein [Marilutibacter aestuarii]|uniref:Uncharacterized protein n=1 Tax=Marilutibacter aestuarii TaxID=1706195 RepID=A0A507ZWW1_9GAMM|nr:hypothetical protein [Lysobacter aestuarii]TQD40973.1 hypothetical protein FKV25_14115 [Lysobacter aestuarii]
MSRYKRGLVFRTLFTLVLMIVVGMVVASPSNKWRLEVSSDADSAGDVVIRLTPEDGTPTDVRIAIPDDTGENHIAKLISDGLKAEVGETYHVEVDDGEDVLVKKRGGPDFDLQVIELTVKGTRIHAQHE